MFLRLLAPLLAASVAIPVSPHDLAAQRLDGLRSAFAVPPSDLVAEPPYKGMRSSHAALGEADQPRRWSVGRSALAGSAVGVGAVVLHMAFRCRRTDVHCGSGDGTAMAFLTMIGGGAAIAGGVVGGATAWLLNHSQRSHAPAGG